MLKPTVMVIFTTAVVRNSAFKIILYYCLLLHCFLGYLDTTGLLVFLFSLFSTLFTIFLVHST